MKIREIRIDHIIIKYPRLFIPAPRYAKEEDFTRKIPESEYKSLQFAATFLVPKSNTDFYNEVMDMSKEIIEEKKLKVIKESDKKLLNFDRMNKKGNLLLKDGDEKYEGNPDTYGDYKGMWAFTLRNYFRGVGKLENVPSVYFTDKDDDGKEVIKPLVYNLTDSDISPVEKNFAKLPYSQYIFDGARVNLKFSLWVWVFTGDAGVSGSIKAVRSLDYNEGNFSYSRDVGVDRYIDDI